MQCQVVAHQRAISADRWRLTVVASDDGDIWRAGRARGRIAAIVLQGLVVLIQVLVMMETGTSICQHIQSIARGGSRANVAIGTVTGEIQYRGS